MLFLWSLVATTLVLWGTFAPVPLAGVRPQDGFFARLSQSARAACAGVAAWEGGRLLGYGLSKNPDKVHPWKVNKVERARRESQMARHARDETATRNLGIDHSDSDDKSIGNDNVEYYNWDAYLQSYLESMEVGPEFMSFRTIPLPTCTHVEPSGDNFNINWGQVYRIAVAILFSYVSAYCLVVLRLSRQRVLIKHYTRTLTPGIRSNTVNASETSLGCVTDLIGLPHLQWIDVPIDIEIGNLHVRKVLVIEAAPTVSVSPPIRKFPSVKEFQLDPRPATPPATAAEVVETPEEPTDNGLPEISEEEQKELFNKQQQWKQRQREKRERGEKEREILQQRRLEKERMRREKEEKKQQKREWRALLNTKRAEREARKRLEEETAQKQEEQAKAAQLQIQQEQETQKLEADLAQQKLEDEERQAELLRRQDQQQSQEAQESQTQADEDEQLRADLGEVAEEPQTEGLQADSDPPKNDGNDDDNEGCGDSDNHSGDDTDHTDDNNDGNDGNEAGKANTRKTRPRKKKNRVAQRARQRKWIYAGQADSQLDTMQATKEEEATEQGEGQIPGSETRTSEPVVAQNMEATGQPEDQATDPQPKPQGQGDEASIKEAQDQILSRLDEQRAAVSPEDARIQAALAAQDEILNRLQQQEEQPQASVNPQAAVFPPQPAFRPAVDFHHQYPQQQAFQHHHHGYHHRPYQLHQPYHPQQFQPQLHHPMPAYPVGFDNQMAFDPAFRPGTPMVFRAGPAFPPPPPSTSNSDSQPPNSGF